MFLLGVALRLYVRSSTDSCSKTNPLLQNSGGEEDDAIATVSSAASNALDRLESAVNMSLNLMETSADAASPELIAADRVVAAAAQRAAAMAKALGVLSSPKEDDTAVQKKA